MKKALSIIISLAIVLSVVYTGAVTLSIPAKADGEKVLSEELVGYRRITPADLNYTTGLSAMVNDGDGDDQVYTLQTNGTKVLYNGEFGGKTYLDADINFNGNSNNFIWQATNDKYNDDNIVVYWKNNSTFAVGYYYKEDGTSKINDFITADATTYGISRSEWFNIKLLTDVTKDSPSEGNESVDIQLWINDTFVNEYTLTRPERSGCMWEIVSNENKVTMRVPVVSGKNIESELKGYRRVDMFDFNKTISNGVVSLESSDSATSYITDYDKTYLDVDVRFRASNKQLQYQAYGKYLACFYMRFDDADTFRLGAYTDYSDNTKTKTLISTVSTTDYGINWNDPFNIKFRTDIVNNGSSETVTYQLWIKNKYVGEGTVTFNYGEAAHTKNIWTTGAIDVISATDVKSQMKGYKRIVPDDYSNLNSNDIYKQSGWGLGSAKPGGSYSGDVSDLSHSYLDVDIKAPTGIAQFLVWLSKNETNPTSFYGDGNQLRFSFSTSNDVTKLVLIKMVDNASSSVEIGNITEAPYNYDPDEFFNLKVKTAIYGANSIGLVVFFNDIYLGKVYINSYDAETISKMTNMGIRGNNTYTTYARSPVYDGVLEDVDYDLSGGNYKLYGAEIKVNGAAKSEGDEISECGTYHIESTDGTHTSYQTVNIYNKVAFGGHSMTLTNSLCLNFLTNLSGLTESQKSSSYVTFDITAGTGTHNIKTVRFSEAVSDNGKYRFACPLSSVQIAETVTPTVHYTAGGDEETFEGGSFSVRKYIDYVVSHRSDFGDKIADLVKSIGDYGHYSQIYFAAKNGWTAGTNYTALAKYRAADYADGDYSDKYDALVSSNKGISATGITNGGNSGKYFQYALNLDYKTSICLKFNTGDVEITSTRKGGVDYTRTNDAATDNNYLYYLLYLPISQLGDPITVAGNVESSAFSIDISGLSYVHAVLGNGSANSALKDVACALYDYYTAAIDYAS